MAPTGRSAAPSRMRARVELLDSDVLVPGSDTGLVPVPGRRYRWRIRTSGTDPVTIASRVWAEGSPEPAGWMLLETDVSVELRAAADIALSAMGMTNVSWHDIVITEP